MKLYFEYIILENLILYFLILIQVNSFLKINIKKLKVILILLIYTIILIIKLITNYNNNILIEIIEMLILIYLYFDSSNFKLYFKRIIVYLYIYTLNISVIIFIVIVTNININNTLNKIFIYLLTFCVCYIINKFFWNVLINNIKNNNLIYTLVLNGKKYKMFLDTGNNLSHTIGDVLIISINKYTKNNNRKIILNKNIKTVNVKIKTINKMEEKKGLIFDNVVIKKNKNEYKLDKVVVVFVDNNFDNQYDGIIGYNTYIKKLGGMI